MSRLEPALSLIVAWAGDKRCIGRNNRLPWHSGENSAEEDALRQFKKDDMDYFRRTTMGKPVIMGYKTWLSIGKPLANRYNIILSRQRRQLPPECRLCANSEDALRRANEWNIANNKEDKEIMVIGGAQVYSQFIDLASRMYITKLNKEMSGDAFFPAYDNSRWDERKTKEKSYGSLLALYFQLNRII